MRPHLDARILALIATRDYTTTAAIARDLGADPAAVDRCVARLARDGRVWLGADGWRVRRD